MAFDEGMACLNLHSLKVHITSQASVFFFHVHAFFIS